MPKPLHSSKYAIKRRSGNMMYGPVKPVPKSPEFKADWVNPQYYWWGKSRQPHQDNSYPNE